MIKIYRAKKKEALDIKKILSEIWEHSYGNIYSPETIQRITSEWHNPEILVSQIKNPDFFFGVAKENNQIVGLTTVRKLNEETLMMYRLYVNPNFQRQGIGSKLVNEAIEVFPKAKRLRIEVEEQNKKGVSFYSKYGFKEVGRKIKKIGSDKIPTIVMEKDL